MLPALGRRTGWQLGHLLVLRRPQRLEVGDRAHSGELVQVGRADELQVGDVVPPAGPLLPRQRPDGIQRRGDGVVPDGVEVQLEAEVAQGPGSLSQLGWVNEQVPVVARRVPMAVKIRRAHRGGERLAHPVEHQLDRGGAEGAGSLGGLAPGEQVFQLPHPVVPVPPQ
jgi:hypothetical protein